MLISLSILVGILLVIDGALFFAHNNQAKNITKQQAAIKSLQDADVNADVLNAVSAKIQYREGIIKGIEDKQILMTNKIDDIMACKPADVSITRLRIDLNGDVEIQAKADKEESILAFYNRLKKSGLSDYIGFNRITGKIGDTAKGFTFGFTFNLKNGSDTK